MNISKVYAVFYKQSIDLRRNVTILFLVFLYPVMTFAFRALLSENQVINMIIPSFITLNIVMTPIITMSNIIAEEKEKNTLRILVMSDVKPMEYFLGVGAVLFGITMLTVLPYLFLLNFTLKEALLYLVIQSFGVVISLMVGAVVGIFIKSQVGVGSVSAPVSMFFGMLPMLTNMNANIRSFSFVLYSQKIYDFLLKPESFMGADFLIIILNLILVGSIFILLYRKKE